MDSIANLHINSCNTENNTIQEAFNSIANSNDNRIILEKNLTAELKNNINICTAPNRTFCNDDIQNKQIFLSTYQNDEEDENENNVKEEENKNNEIETLKSLKVGPIDLTDFDVIGVIYSNKRTIVYLIKKKNSKCLCIAKELINCEFKDFIRELKIHTSIDHPLIVKATGYSLQNFKQEPSKLIIMEHIKNDTLSRILYEERNQISIEILNNTDKLIIILGIAEAVSYLHSKEILHLDLKPENILINEYVFPILCDFGLSMFENCIIQDQPPFGGSLPYCSPEVLKNETRTKKSDSFSFGLLIYVMITKKIPFENRGFYCFQYDIYNGRYKLPKLDDSIPEFFRILIEMCCQFDPEKRPEFIEIIKYIKDFKDFNKIGVDESVVRTFIEFVESHEKGIDSTFRLDEKFKKYKLNELYKKQKKESQSSSSFLSCFSTEEEEEEDV